MAVYPTYNPKQNTVSSLWDTNWAKQYASKNPYEEYYNTAGNFAKNQMNAVQANNPMTSGAGGGAASWNYGYPDLSNPETMANIGRYGEGVMSQQRNALDEYVKRAGTAGVQRGGFNVQGGPAYASALHQDAINNLAGGAANRFKEGLEYTKGLYGSMYNNYNQQQDQAAKLMSLWLQGLGQGASWDTNLFGMRRGDYTTDQQAQAQWQQGEAQRYAQYYAQLQQEQAQAEARNAANERQNRMNMALMTPLGSSMNDATMRQWNQMLLQGESPFYMGGLAAGPQKQSQYIGGENYPKRAPGGYGY